MQSFALVARDNVAFRLTLDLSAFGAVGQSLAPAVLRMHVKPPGALASAPPTLEFVTGSANPIVFDPATGLAVFSAPASAMAGKAGSYAIDARAELATGDLPLFAGTLTIRAGVTQGSASAGLPSADTAWLAAQPFGPAPVPAAIASSVAAAQAAAKTALLRALVMGT